MAGTGLSVWAAGWDSGCEHVWRVGKAVSGLKVCVAGHVGECGTGQFAETGCEVSVSAMSVPRRGGGRLEENRCSGHHHQLSTAYNSARSPRPGQEPGCPQGLAWWGSAVQTVFVSSCLLPPLYSHRPDLRGPAHNSNHPPEPASLEASPAFLSVSSPRLGWPPPLPMPSLLSLSVTAWTLGGNLREERRRPVAGSGFWPSQRQAGAMLYLYPSKGDPC